MDTLIGQTLAHYRIVEKIGAGGMGEVYRARDTRLDRDVAIKVLPDAFSSDPDRLARFEREAKVLASLNHPNLGAIYGLEEVTGRRYLALEYVEGETLAAQIARGALPLEDTVEICLQIASGMEAAHEAGIVHRDLKPGNVMITPGDVVKVVDFGLAKVRQPVDSEMASEDASTFTASPETAPGVILGTAGYVPPEQARGKIVDRRADIWSFGCVLYECLTGTRPFRGGTPAETIGKILERDPDWSAIPAGTPPGLLRLLQHCLEKDPKHRLRDMGDARLALEELKGEAACAGRAPNGRRRRKPLAARLLPAGALLVAIVVAAWIWNTVGPGKRRLPGHPASESSTEVPGDDLLSAATPSIAVLPFADLSPEKDQGYFADGVSEELISVLARIRGLRVVSRTSAFSFKGKNADLATVAQQLNVAMVVEGSVRKAGNRLRITAQLIQVSTDSHLWSQTYDREFKDIFAIQQDIAQSVVAEMRARLSGAGQGTPASAKTRDEVAAATMNRGTNPEAYALYLEGRFYLNRNTRADLAKAVSRFREAVALDPSFALAWASLAEAASYQAGNAWVLVEAGFREAREAAERAILLEPDLAEAYAALGRIQMWRDWDLAAAESSIRKALDLAPGNTDVVRAAADLAANQGKLEDAVSLGRRAVALDPLSVPALRYVGGYAFQAGLLDEAEAAQKKALELSPEQFGTHAALGLTYLAQGRMDDALAEASAEEEESLRLWALATIHHAAGHREESVASLEKLIEKYAQGWAFQVAEVCAFRGERDKAFEWLERAYRQHDPGLIQIRAVGFFFNPIRDDPRWGRFLRKIGIPE